MSGGTVAELVKGLHDEAAQGLVDVMTRYTNMVRKAAGGTLSHDEAVIAASIAYEMGLPVDRFDRDVAVVKAERALVAQMERDEAEKAASNERGRAYREKLKALEAEHRETQMAMKRMTGEAMNRAQRKVDHAQMHAANPHLFKPADTLNDDEWKAVRA